MRGARGEETVGGLEEISKQRREKNASKDSKSEEEGRREGGGTGVA